MPSRPSRRALVRSDAAKTGEERPDLVKMSELARRCDLPAATIKHYMREGLVPSATLRTSRNMAWYDAGLVSRIRAIKEIQRTQFLPLRMIKAALEGAPSDDTDALVAHTLAQGLAALAKQERRTRTQLVDGGMPADQLAYFESLGILSPEPGPGGERIYAGDDLALLRTLGAARRAGLSADMLPHTILEPYLRAIGELVRVELKLFKSQVVPRSGQSLPVLVEHAARLSEQLITLLRRKMLLPMLAELAKEERPAADAARPRRARARAGPGRSRH